MAGFNNVILLGNITRDIELRYTTSGTAVCDIGLAVNQKRKSGEEVVFVDCTCWEKTAELASEYLSKGRQVLVRGRLKMDEWNDKGTGQKRSKIGVVVNELVFVGGPASQAEAVPSTPDDEQGKLPIQHRIADVPKSELDELPF
jgi:single-strand DNA-binding protein